MRAAVLREIGAAPRPEEFAEPTASAGREVVEVLAAGMNPVELLLARGGIPGRTPSLPYVVGREAVVRRSDGGRCFVIACVAPFGSMAERTLVASGSLIELPGEIDDDAGVAMGTAGLAAWVPLTRIAPVAGESRVLILGASGVVGQLAVQVARLLGAARVVAAARSERGLARARVLGAEETIAIGEPGELQRDLIAAGQFDVILDLVYGDAAIAALGALAPWGTIVQVGCPAADAASIPAPLLRACNGSLVGYSSAGLAFSDLASSYLGLVERAANREIAIPVERVALADVEDAWARQAAGPQRKLVVLP